MPEACGTDLVGGWEAGIIGGCLDLYGGLLLLFILTIPSILAIISSHLLRMKVITSPELHLCARLHITAGHAQQPSGSIWKDKLYAPGLQCSSALM